ncbi:MAG: hypothetical protein WAV09_03445 [Minisyncoccia bacterium]
MKIRSDMLKISSGALNIKGEKLEPEEQIARREVVMEAPVKLGNGAAGGRQVGVIPSKIVTEQSAGVQAVAMRSLCGNCVHFANEKWIKDLAAADAPDSPIEKRRAVNQIRAAILQTQSPAISDASTGQDNDLDIEHALRTLGYCKALYVFLRNTGKNDQEAVTLVHPSSTCPEDVRKELPPDGFFEFASPEAKKIANANYDRVMKMAQGKK